MTADDPPSCLGSVLQGRDYKMGVGSFINDSRRILKLATKPSRTELWTSTKISLLAMVVVGALSFIIQVIMIVITSNWGTTAT